MNRSVLCGLASFAILVGAASFSSSTSKAEAGLFGHRGGGCAGVCAGGVSRGGGLFGHHRRGGCAGGGLFGGRHHRGGGCAGNAAACCGMVQPVYHGGCAAPQQACCPQVCPQPCPPVDCCPTTGHYGGGVVSGGGCVDGCYGGGYVDQGGHGGAGQMQGGSGAQQQQGGYGNQQQQQGAGQGQYDEI